MSATTSPRSGLHLSGAVARALLVVWTVGIWGSRVRNIIADDDLVGFELVTALAIAIFLVVTALAVGVSMARNLRWHGRALGVLIIAGVARFTTRGITILLSDEWGTAFKVVHTTLWLVTVVLSVLAAREYSKVRSSAWVSS